MLSLRLVHLSIALIGFGLKKLGLFFQIFKGKIRRYSCFLDRPKTHHQVLMKGYRFFYPLLISVKRLWTPTKLQWRIEKASRFGVEAKKRWLFRPSHWPFWQNFKVLPKVFNLRFENFKAKKFTLLSHWIEKYKF